MVFGRHLQILKYWIEYWVIRMKIAVVQNNINFSNTLAVAVWWRGVVHDLPVLVSWTGPVVGKTVGWSHCSMYFTSPHHTFQFHCTNPMDLKVEDFWTWYLYVLLCLHFISLSPSFNTLHFHYTSFNFALLFCFSTEDECYVEVGMYL